jgi:chromate transporter
VTDASGFRPRPRRPATPTRAEAFRYWLKLGFVSFGGPAGQIAIMHHDLVETKRWISERRFLHALNYCMVLPGPKRSSSPPTIGWLMHRTWGGVVAGGLFVLPSLVLLIALSWLYSPTAACRRSRAILYGIKPAVSRSCCTRRGASDRAR